ncbi:hypothetical protein Tco_0295695 [Tanacetum coccineum]
MRMEQYLTHTDYALWEVIVNGDTYGVASASTEDNTRCTNEVVNTANDVSVASSQGQASSSTYADDVAMLTMRMKRFIKKTCRNVNFNGKETVGFDRIKIKWYSCHRRGHFARERTAPKNQGNRNVDNTRRVVPVETLANALVVQDGIGGYDWSVQAKKGPTNFALMAYTSQSSSSSDSEVHTCSKDCLKSFETLQKQYDQQYEALNKSSLEIISYQMGLESLEARIVVHEKNEAVYKENSAFLKYDVQVKDISIEELKSQLENASKKKDDSDEDDNPVNDRFKTDESILMSAVRKTITNVPETESSTSKDIVENSKTARPSAPIIENWESDSEDDCMIRPSTDQIKPMFTKISFVKSGDNVKFVNKENTHRQAEFPRKVQSPRSNRRNLNGMMTQKLGNGFEFIKKACFVYGSFNHLIKDCDFSDKRMVENLCLEMRVRLLVKGKLDQYGTMFINAAKQISYRAATSASTTRPVNIAALKPKVNGALPTTYSYFKAHSPVRRPFNQKSTAKTNNFNRKINTAKVNVTTTGLKVVVSAAKGNRGNAGNLQLTLQDQGIFESGCSRHMTGNKSFLTDYQEIDGGFVAFTGSPKGGRKPTLSFMRPFGCPVTILNTLDHLGTGPNWMFDIDTLTMSMNYQPVFAGNQTNGHPGPKGSEDKVFDDTSKKNGVLDPTKEGDMNGQGDATNTNNTNRHNTVSSLVKADINTASPIPNDGIFSGAYDDKDVDAEDGFNNLETTMTMIDYSLWEVIENGATLPKTQVVEGVVKPMPITFAEDKAQRRIEVKARSTLLMGIPNEHQLKFYSIKDAKLLLEAVEKRFGGNDATKKTQRNLLKQKYENFTASSSEMLDQTFDWLQKLVSHLELLGEKLLQEDINQKLLRSSAPEWDTHAIV